MRARAAAGAVAFLALAGGGAIVPAAPASAAPPEILLSEDGSTFTPDLTANLFDDLALIVPGDEIHARLWVHNSSSTTALMRVVVNDMVIPSPVFGDALTLTTTANGSTFASALSSLNTCDVVVQTVTVRAGTSVRVDLDLLMSDATSGLDAQGETASLNFRVYAHEAAAGPFPPGNGCTTIPNTGGSSGTGQRLPWTGVELVSTLFVACALIGGGILVAVLRRRRRPEESQQS